MAGNESALVLFPRFTSFVGSGDWTSVPLDCSAYGTAQIELWRGPLVGGGGGGTATFGAFLEESLDGVRWQPDAASAHAYDPGEGASVVLAHVFSMRWFRIRIKLDQPNPGNPKPQVTCWAEGMLR